MKIKSDVLTESEKQFFIDKILTHYHERYAKRFTERFEYLPDESLKQRIARIDEGFAVSDIYGGVMTSGRFYLIINNDIYRVASSTQDDDVDMSKILLPVRKNGFEKVTDKNIVSICENVNQFFLQMKNSI